MTDSGAGASPCPYALVVDLFGDVQALLTLVMTIAGTAIKGFALADSLRRRPEVFPAAGKRTKNVWVAILGVALAVDIVQWGAPLALLNIVGAVAAIVYLVDVRPAVRALGGGRGTSGQHMGPYGPW